MKRSYGNWTLKSMIMVTYTASLPHRVCQIETTHMGISTLHYVHI